jgi:hypothetical protein
MWKGNPMTDDGIETKNRHLGLERAEWWFVAKWVLATIGGGLVGLLIGGIAFWAIAARWDDPDVSMPMLLLSVATAFVSLSVSAVVGLVGIGTAQWLVLRDQVHRAGWWVLATAVGGIVGVVVGVIAGVAIIGVVERALDESGVLVVALGVAMVLGGAVGGTAQWLVLRVRVRLAGWWVLATVVGVGLGGFVGGAVLRGIAETMGPTSGMVVDVAVLSLGPLAGGVVFGVITGIVLVTYLEHPKVMPQAVNVPGEEATG